MDVVKILMVKLNYSKLCCLCIIVITIVCIRGIIHAENIPMNLFVDGIEAFDAKLYDSALKKFSLAQKLEPSNLEYKYYSALTYSRLGKDLEALRIFDSIIQKDPNSYYKAYFDASAVCTKIEDYKKALIYLAKAEWAKPLDPRVYMEKGYIYQRMSKFRTASSCFNRAAEIDPSLKQVVYYNIGSLFMNQGDYEKAEFMFLNSNKLNPDSPFAANSMAAALAARRGKRYSRKFQSSFYSGIGYDDNIAAELERPENNYLLKSNNSDFFYTELLNTDYYLFNSNGIKATAGYIYSGFFYNHSEFEDIEGHIPHFIFSSSGEKFRQVLRYDFSYYFADREKRAKSDSLLYNVSIDTFNNGLRSDLNLNYINNTYLDNGKTPDSYNVSCELIESFRAFDGLIVLRGGYKSGIEKSESKYSSFILNSIHMGALLQYKNKIFFDLMIKGTMRSYDRYIGAGGRKDEEFVIVPALTIVFNDYVDLRLSWQRTKNDSNVIDDTDTANVFDPFRFEKNVVSCVLGLKL